MKKYLRQDNFSTEILIFNMVLAGGVWLLGLYILIIIKPSMVSYALACLISFGAIAYYHLYLVHFTVEYVVMLDDENRCLILTNKYNKQKKIPYEEIIELFSKGRDPSLVTMRFATGSDFSQFKLDYLLDNFGYAIEQIIQRAINLQKVNLSENLFKPSIWQKKPDLIVINAAKRRAEENRRKAEAREPVS